jgi:hypothetical protein
MHKALKSTARKCSPPLAPATQPRLLVSAPDLKKHLTPGP